MSLAPHPHGSRRPPRPPFAALVVAALVLAGSGCGDGNPRATATDFSVDGPHPVGNATATLHDVARDRSLDVEVWYPAAEGARAAAAIGAPVADFLPPGELRDRYAALLAGSPDPGPTRRTRSARGASPARVDEPWPVVVFSHCHTCTRFSGLSIAQRLASHGFVVAAPDHAGNTVFDDRLPLTTGTLEVRAADVRAVLDALLDPSASAAILPEGLRGRIDANRVGVFGHSFGSVTTGLVLQEDRRFRAGAGLAAPFENPLIPGVRMDAIDEPILFLVAREDNSITEIGNQLIRANFDASRGPAWKVEVTDAGHWSFSDLCHLGTLFTAGCGDGVRQTVPGESFTYLPIDRGLEIASSWVAAFFAAELNGDAAGRAFLGSPPGAGIAVDARP